MANLEGLIIKNYYTELVEGATVNYNVSDDVAWESDGYIPRHYLIMVSGQQNVIRDGVMGEYRVQAEDLSISGIPPLSNPMTSPWAESSGYTIGMFSTTMLDINGGDNNTIGPGYSYHGFMHDLGLPGYPAGGSLNWILNDPPNLNFSTSNFTFPFNDPDLSWHPGYGGFTQHAYQSLEGAPGFVQPNKGKPQYQASNVIEDIFNEVQTAYPQWLTVSNAYISSIYDGQAIYRNSCDAIRSWMWFNTVGSGIDGIPVTENKVAFIVTLKDGWTVPAGGAELLTDINGEGIFIPYAASAQPVPQNPTLPFETRIILDGSYNSTVTTTSSNTVTHDTIDKGFKKQKEDISISGLVKRNTPTVITSIKIEADSGYYLSKKPYLKTKYQDNIKMVIRSKTKTSGKIKSYTIDLVYSNNKSTNSRINDILYINNNEKLTANISYKIEQIHTRTAVEITDLSINTSPIKSDGDKRMVTITGAPGATFGIAINENILEEIVDQNPDVSITRWTSNKGNDVSILSNNRRNDSHDYGYGKKLPIFTGTIGPSGVYSFTQQFPSCLVSSTKMSSGITTSRDVSVTDASNVNKHDRLYSREMGSIKIPIVDSVNYGTNVVTVGNDYSLLTLSDKEPVVFRRNKSYSVDIIPDLSSTLSDRLKDKLFGVSSNAITIKPAYTISQYTKKTFTFSMVEGSGTNFTITSFNDNTTGLSSSNDHEYSKELEVGAACSEIIKLKYLVTCSSSVASVTPPTSTSYTNLIASNNGGTYATLSNFTHTAVGSTTITLTFDLYISEMGYEDVDVSLDLDNILTLT